MAAPPVVPPQPLNIIVSFLVRDPGLRDRCGELVRTAANVRQLERACGLTHTCEINTENPPDDAADLLSHLFEAPGRVVVVVSDAMAVPPGGAWGESPVPAPWWQQLVDDSPDDRLGSVAVTGWAPRRVPDVDRVVPPGFGWADLCDAVGRVVRTLEYKQAPPQRSTLDETVKVRHVRTRDELRAYYLLRHRVYSVMGYLDHEVEAVPAGMEFDWYDRFSVPVGAFVDAPDGRSRLVGTARLITPPPRQYNPDFLTATRDFAAEDGTGVLAGRFEETPAFETPFLQSLPDSEIVTELQRDYADAFCEVSRVIVDPTYRGVGLSKLLARYTLTVARWMGMRRIFLECLPTHRRLYEQFRFRAVPNRRQRVYNVNKTMVLMEWSGPAPPAPAGAGPRRAELQRLGREGFLCLCRHAHCPAERPWYSLHGSGDCPLAGGPPGAAGSHLLRQWDGMGSYYDEFTRADPALRAAGPDGGPR